MIDLPNSLRASSISIPPGWSVTLTDGQGFADRCESWENFDQGFLIGPDSYLTGLNDNVHEIIVHQGCPANLPPNRVSLNSPANATDHVDTAPTLHWNYPGDPNGDELRYYVEVTGNNRTIASGWIDNTVWRPGGLDYQYDRYQWRVKARDIRGAESAWSDTWSFIIRSPNYPPSISFSSANGSGLPSGALFTREGNWTFTGTASDPEGQLTDVQWFCSGDGCGSTTHHSGTTNWSHSQNNMSGSNKVYFVAYDDYGHHTSSRQLDLRIDLAAPTTTPGLNGQSNSTQWPTWFTAPVTVGLHGADNGTGSAQVGMGIIHYRLDTGVWQTAQASDLSFTVSSDGGHVVEYYSEDALGNVEGARSFTFQIDQTPPTLPPNLQETHGVVSDRWQKEQNVPTFTWDPAFDATSGVRGYRFYFGDDPNGIGYKDFLASEPRQWTPFLQGIHTGTYYLRARTQDNAGNWSGWGTLFIFRYDNTPPENPSGVTHAAGITTEWQNTTSQANFSWTAAHDEGSGIQGYFIYWGLNAAGTSTTLTMTNAYKNFTPLCAINAACIGYLRIRSIDQVGNLAEDWNTVFVVRYDNVPPVVDFTFNSGTQTTQSQVTLMVNASDEGSGVYAARFSSDDQKWTDWEQPSAERLWRIPPISRQSWPVYAQVRDHVGLLSEIVMHDVYLDVNPLRPVSLNYRVFDFSLSGGSGAYSSSSYNGRGTLGQVSDSPISSSPNYSLHTGYETGSQAIPLIVPGHDKFTSRAGVFTSGVVVDVLSNSAGNQMMFTLGGIGLPSTTTITSASYQHQPGFLATLSLQHKNQDQIIVPPPQPEPTLLCQSPSISINEGTAYTRTPQVTLNLCAPYAVEMMISDREDFTGARWEPFTASKAWTLLTDGSLVTPRYIYAQFKETNGKIHTGYFDDILYDPNRPVGSLLMKDDIANSPIQLDPVTLTPVSVAMPQVLQAAPDGSVSLYIDGWDDNSGVMKMQISASEDFTGAAWQNYSPVVSYLPQGGDGLKTVFARFEDGAGNLSPITSVNFIYDTQPPEGYLFADPGILPVDATTVTLSLGDYSYNSEGSDVITTYEGRAVEMRLGTTPDLANAYWQPLVDTLVIPIYPTPSNQGNFYVQYRDAAGNTSAVYSDTYKIDITAPELLVVAQPGTGDTRILNIYADDDLSEVSTLYFSNDPLMQAGVVTQPYTNSFTWIFDARKVVWMMAEDGVGNRSQPYPAYATDQINGSVQIFLPLVTK